MGAELDPDAVSRILKLQPSEAHRKGDARPASTARKYAPFNEGLWCLSSELSEDRTLAEHLEALLGELAAHKKALAAIRKNGCRQDIFIGMFSGGGNQGFVLSLETLGRLHELGVEVNFDLYP
ncbi:MAG: DUF4279 domain-containing protein [Elusimicrobia bacterium]|nr:DUF4279 domain-containing protein [Elusimicrobiota bacterium]